MTARDTITVTADQLERWVFEAAEAGRTLEITAGPTTMSLKIGRRTFIAPLAAPVVPSQRKASE